LHRPKIECDQQGSITVNIDPAQQLPSQRDAALVRHLACMQHAMEFLHGYQVYSHLQPTYRYLNNPGNNLYHRQPEIALCMATLDVWPEKCNP
jgi:hypothetical protein